MIKVVLFDWDGTLADNTDIWFNAYNDMRENFSLQKISLAQFRAPFGDPFHSKFTPKFGITDDIKIQAVNNWLDNYTRLSKSLRMIDGVLELLAELKGEYKLGIVTSGNRERIKEEMAKLKLSKYFDVISTKEDHPEPKPHPGRLEVAVKRLGVKPEDCVYVGDMDADIIAAKSCGMKSIGVSWGLNTFEALSELKPDFVARNLDELHAAIKALK